MAGRGRTSFQKRLKEQKRLERRQQKAANKLARKAAKSTSTEEVPAFGAEEPGAESGPPETQDGPTW